MSDHGTRLLTEVVLAYRRFLLEEISLRTFQQTVEATEGALDSSEAALKARLRTLGNELERVCFGARAIDRVPDVRRVSSWIEAELTARIK